MNSPELQQAWKQRQEEIKNEAAREAAQAAVQAAAQAEAIDNHRQLTEHARHAGLVALTLTDVVGWSQDEQSFWRYLRDTRVSNLIELGPIDENEGVYGFARVHVDRAQEEREVTVPRRFRKPKVTSELVASDKFTTLSTRFYAGDAEGGDLALISWGYWSKDQSAFADEENLTQVEDHLAYLSEKLGVEVPTE